jgi:serine/threonine protein kinase
MSAPRDHFRQVDGIFDAALDLAPNERDAFVTTACGTDRALRDRVRTLLDAHDRSRDFLQSPAVELAAVLLDEPATVPSVPDRAGPFRIVRELGAGGMGVVYLAEREDAEFQQRVALKLVRHVGASDAMRRRFLEERRILALLEHPGIAHLIDGGLTSDGLPYFAMELVDGEPIDAYCAARNLTIEQRLDLFIGVCEAVQYAHEHLVIHRDLKPSNILVRADGQLKLLDFGIAKLLDPLRVSDDAGATQTGVIALTPEYAAPEQMRGQPVSTATDTYALGVLLYVLLAGRRPYDVRGQTPAEVERIVCEVEPPRPSSVAPDKTQRTLRGDLDLIVMKALHKDPARRYSAASALRDDLRRYRTGLPVLARPDSAGYRLRKFVRRNRTVVAVLGVTLVALAGAAAFSAAQMREAQRQRDAAVLEARRQRSLAEVQSVLAGDSRDAEGRELSAPQRIALAEQVLAQEFSGQPWLVVEGMEALGSRLYEVGAREAERAMLARALVIAGKTNLPTHLARIECERAYSLSYDDQLDSARAAIAASRVALLRPGAQPSLATVVCLDAEGQLLVAEEHPDSAIAVFRRAVAAAQGEAATLRLQVMLDLSQALRGVGRTREASVFQRQIVLDLDSAGFRGTSILPNVIGYLTSALFELGEIATVDSVVRAALQAQSRIPGQHSSGNLDFLLGLANLRLGELDTAETWITRATRDTTEGAGGLSAYLPPAITQLRLEQGRIADARKSLADLPKGTLVRRVNRSWLTARVRHAEGDARGAAGMLEDSLRALVGSAAKPPPSLAMPLVTLAEWRLDAGDARGADSLAMLGRAAAAVDSTALQRSAYAGRAELVRARARKALGDEPMARLAADRAIVALSYGYGPSNRHTRDAQLLRDGLSNSPQGRGDGRPR